MSPRFSAAVRRGAFVVASLLAGAAPLWSRASSTPSPSVSAEAWSSLVDPGWARVPLTERDRVFASAQAGPIARFHKGSQRLVVRRVAEASRSLHPAADCLRAVGYEVERLPSTRAKTRGASAWLAHRAGEKVRVEEWIVDARGRRFSEVGEWYWQALLARSEGPWVAYVLSRPLD